MCDCHLPSQFWSYMHCSADSLGLITSRCSRKEPALLSRRHSSWGGHRPDMRERQKLSLQILVTWKMSLSLCRGEVQTSLKHMHECLVWPKACCFDFLKQILPKLLPSKENHAQEKNGPYPYSSYRTETSLQLRLMQGNFLWA